MLSFLGCVACAVVLLLMRRGAPVWLTGNLLIGFLAIRVFLADLLSGGAVVVPYILSSLFPITAVVATGRKAGTIWTGVFVVPLTILAGLWAHGMEVPLEQVSRGIGASVAWIPIAAVFALALILAYETLRVEQINRLRETQSALGEVNARLFAKREEHDRDLEAARRTQLAILPSDEVTSALYRKTGLRISAVYEPLHELGGDCWFLREIDPGRIGVYVADFTGHGVNAALNTVRLHVLVDTPSLVELRDDPAAQLEGLNRKLHDLLPTGQFAALIYGIVELDADRFVYSACGATEAIAITASGKVALGNPEGVPLGISARSRYESRSVPLGVGDHLILYTDGLVEMPDRNGACLSAPGLSELARRHLEDPQVSSLASAIYADFVAGLDGEAIDDITLVCIGREALPSDTA